ncbi:PAS domain-containing protein [bacterium]|nr:PAS domain-containing protein [bacterium]
MADSEDESQRWRAVVENVPETILTIGRDRRIHFINRTDSSLPPAQIVGLHFLDFIQVHDREWVGAAIESVFETGHPCSYETEACEPQGPILGWYSCRAGPIFKGGQVDSVVIVASNVTESRRIHDELRQSQARLRRLGARQQSALEDERRRIAREIHDELGQMLTALRIDLSCLERRLENGADYERVLVMKQIVDGTMATVRRISSSLRPPLLDELGPRAALAWLIQETCTRAGLTCSLSTTLGKTPLDEECSLAIFRICQEALTNVVRHARASRAEVRLTVEGDRIDIQVTDDGVGISDTEKDGSLGLLGLQERAERLGGSVTIEGHPGRGTTVRAHLFLRSVSEEGASN